MNSSRMDAKDIKRLLGYKQKEWTHAQAEELLAEMDARKMSILEFCEAFDKSGYKHHLLTWWWGELRRDRFSLGGPEPDNEDYPVESAAMIAIPDELSGLGGQHQNFYCVLEAVVRAYGAWHAHDQRADSEYFFPPSFHLVRYLLRSWQDQFARRIKKTIQGDLREKLAGHVAGVIKAHNSYELDEGKIARFLSTLRGHRDAIRKILCLNSPPRRSPFCMMYTGNNPKPLSHTMYRKVLDNRKEYDLFLDMRQDPQPRNRYEWSAGENTDRSPGCLLSRMQAKALSALIRSSGPLTQIYFRTELEIDTPKAMVIALRKKVAAKIENGEAIFWIGEPDSNRRFEFRKPENFKFCLLYCP
jgi:hypothetical protein